MAPLGRTNQRQGKRRPLCSQPAKPPAESANSGGRASAETTPSHLRRRSRLEARHAGGGVGMKTYQQCGFRSSMLSGIQVNRMKKKVVYSDYIYRILKQVPQDTSKCCWAVDVIRCLNKPHLYGKVALEAARLSHYKKKPLVTSTEVHTAVRLVLLTEAVKDVSGISEGQF
ncbi:histone H2B, gonadal-like isoform X2 [Rhineura floridana]|uniref:histone H2B, gonadal-like isoform X2 n=1 Tax=Rhineura floridana TaxID=261503 RepID=UPI002AC8164F|nr:histone H2B, gonadal-like isoform X2 [Rhineura floridana]